jgi:hypothetical protein
MRKRSLTPTIEANRSNAEGLDIERTAIVEVSSEEETFPVESALGLDETLGWRAAHPGTQVIRLVFDHPQMLKQIRLIFEETQATRTQEFALRWSSDGGRKFQEIVRQQWTFSPPTTVRETEVYQAELLDVNVLELVIIPDISGGSARATLKSLRLY